MKRVHLFCLIWLAAAASLVVSAEEDADAESRRRFEALQAHPERLERLRKDYQAFQALPPERRKQLLKLDEELQRQSPPARVRLLSVAERYAEWLSTLDEKDRKRLLETTDKAARLGLIRDLKDEQWIKLQPKVNRDKYASLEGKEKTEYIQKLRKDERQRKFEWMIAGRFWKELEGKTPLPARLSDFKEGKDGKDVEPFVNEYLRPRLSKEENDQLDRAQGHWPLFPMTLVELADRHPPALPGPEGPRTFAELPKEVQIKLGKGKLPGAKRLPIEGKWPDFAIGVAQLAAKRPNPLILPNELWPYNFKCLSPPMQDFVTNKLEKVLTAEEKLRLLRAEQEAKWPNYPLTIQELAQHHYLTPPWFSLPGSREKWDGYRIGKGP